MSEEVYIPNNGTDWLQLSRKSTTGTQFKKHILTRGPLRHPKTGNTIDIDDKKMKEIMDNFRENLVPIVQFPLADENNSHTQAVDRNAGEVVELEYDAATGKLYSIIDVRKYAGDVGQTILGASAYIDLHRIDSATGDDKGAALVHVLATNNPYLTNLERFESIVKASSESAEDVAILEEIPVESADYTDVTAVIPDEESVKMTKEEMIEALKAEFNVDVTALESKVSELTTANAGLEEKAALSNVMAEALTNVGAIQLSNSEVSSDDIIGAVAQLADNNVKLSAQVTELTTSVTNMHLKAAQDEVDALVKAGRVLPVQRDAFVEIRLSNPATFAVLVPAEPIVKLSAPAGTSVELESVSETNEALEMSAAMAKTLGLVIQ